MHNPYLMGAGLPRAIDDGIRRKLGPGAAEQRNIHEVMDEVKSKHTKLPVCLEEALDALDEDEVARSALPAEIHKVFMHYQRDEWDKFLATVTA